MGLLLLDLPSGSTPTIFLIDPVTLELAGEEEGYEAEPLDLAISSRWFTCDVGDLPAGKYLVASTGPIGSGWVDTSIGSSPWPVTDGVFSRLNIAWIGGSPVVVGDLAVDLLSSVSARCGKLPIYWGEDHYAAESRAITIDGIVDDLDGATCYLTIKASDGTKVIDALASSSVDNTAKKALFELPRASADDFDLEETYFFFCQARYANGHRITVKRGQVELLDTAESSAPL